MQLFFNGMSQRRLSAPGQAGKPDDRTTVSILRFAAIARHRGMMPYGIGRFGGAGHGADYTLNGLNPNLRAD